MNKFERLFILLIVFINISCGSQLQNAANLASSNNAQNSNVSLHNNSGNRVENNISVQSKDPIYSVDFKNFAFPMCPKYLREIVPEMKSIKLNEGKSEIEKGQLKSKEDLRFKLTNVSYHDLTRDGKKDAVVTIDIGYFKGSENCTFIYSVEKGNPKLLWTHQFGSDANGGIRRLAFEKGGLLVEEYKTEHYQAVCCPKSYTRSLYIWDGKQFIKKESEVLPTDIKGNLFLGYP